MNLLSERSKPILREDAEKQYRKLSYFPWDRFSEFIEVSVHKGWIDLCGLQDDVAIYLSTRSEVKR